MLSTQPGSTPLASFKVVSLERSEPHPSSAFGNMLGKQEYVRKNLTMASCVIFLTQ